MSRLRYLTLVAGVVFISATPIHAQVVPQSDGHTVSVRAEGISISKILAELTRLYPLERMVIDPAVHDHPVWVMLDNVSLRTALIAILKDSGLDFAVSGRRVIVSISTVTDTRAIGGAVEGRPLAPAVAGQMKTEAAVYAEKEQSDAERQASEAAIEAESAMMQGISAAAGDETNQVVLPPVRFIANGENITYLEPGYVPYKMRPHVRALRLATDVATIP